MVDADETITAAEDGAVLDAPDYRELRAKAARLDAEPDPVPSLGRQGSQGVADEPGETLSSSGGANAFALRLLHAVAATAPDLSRFPAAVDVGPDGARTFVADVGDIVVVNVFAGPDVLDSRLYLKTVKGRVTGVDTVTGVVSLFDVDRKQQTCCCFRRSDPMHLRWPGRKMREAQSELFERAQELLASDDTDSAVEALKLLERAKGLGGRAESAGSNVVAKRKVGRPRRQRTPEELEKQRLHAERKARGEVKLGRPKGTKNRPKEVVDAEKLRLAKERRDRRGTKLRSS